METSGVIIIGHSKYRNKCLHRKTPKIKPGLCNRIRYEGLKRNKSGSLDLQAPRELYGVAMVKRQTKQSD